MTLCKQDLVRKIASTNGYPKHETSQLLESLLELITSSLESSERLMISSFDRIELKRRRHRCGSKLQAGNALTLNVCGTVTVEEMHGNLLVNQKLLSSGRTMLNTVSQILPDIYRERVINHEVEI